MGIVIFLSLQFEEVNVCNFYVYRLLDHHDIISIKLEYNDSSKCLTSAQLAWITPDQSINIA